MADDLRFMQQEAARRVRRMQERNRQVFEQYGGRTSESLAASRPSITPPPLYDRPCPREAPAPEAPPPLTKPAITLDNEQWLLLGLALLLFRSGCRAELVIALLYLAM